MLVESKKMKVKDKKNKSSSFNLIVGTHKTKIQTSNGFPYKEKILILGDIYEVYHYEKPVFVGYKRPDSISFSDTNEEEKIENRKKVVTRIRNRVRRLALANFNENSK